MNRNELIKKIANTVVTDPNLTAGFVSIVGEEVNLSELERIYTRLMIISASIDLFISSKN